MCQRQLVELPLNIERADGLAIFQPHDPGASRVAGNVARALDGIGQNKILRQPALFEQRQDAGSRPDFQSRRKRAHVRIADEQMKPAIFSIIGERLVAGVDDGAVELHPLVDVVDDVVGPLAELEIDADLRAAGAENRTRAGSPARPGRRR